MVNAHNKLILLSAGGTGGHMFPADALARDLLSRGYRVALATDTRGKKYAGFVDGVPTYVLSSGGLHPGIVSKVKTIISLVSGYCQARKLMKDIQPAVVVGFGGYPSFPAVYAAQAKNIPTIIHEQNAVIGQANAMLAPKASKIASNLSKVEGVSMEKEARLVITGNPVRPDIAALYNMPYPPIAQDGPLRIFVMGGSQGASVFSDVLPAAFANLAPAYRARLDIVQQAREADIETLRAAYNALGIKAHLQTFFSDVPARLEQAHLVISRSGASTVAEVTTAGRPAIFVPYPHHADQQQKKNADAVADMGGAWVMTQNGFTPDALLARIETFLQNPPVLAQAAEKARACGKPDAARRLGNLVASLASG